MTKAEEQSYKFWPVKIRPTPFAPDEQDVNEVNRKIWQDGYEHAEKDMFQTILVVLEKNYGFDTLDRVEFVMKYERMIGESIPDDWLEKGVMKTVKLQSLEQKKNAD